MSERPRRTLPAALPPTVSAATNLREKRAGDPINLEFDLLGKYVEKLMLTRAPGAAQA